MDKDGADNKQKPQQSNPGGNDDGSDEQDRQDSSTKTESKDEKSEPPSKDEKEEESVEAAEKPAGADSMDANKDEGGAEEEGREDEEERMETDLLADEELKMAPAKDSEETEESDVYAHKNEPQAEEDVSRPTLDQVRLEHKSKSKLTMADLEKRKRRESEKEEGGEKSELKQDVGGGRKRQKKEDGEDGMEDATTNLVSRGDTNTVAEGDLESIGRGLDHMRVQEEEEEEEAVAKDAAVAPGQEEHSREWSRLCSETSSLSRQLAERLRLVIEPTRAARFRGDFKTGKRLNMRRIVPYIASNFRRDKIWLRRTRPSKRDCKIIIALDDSSSMSDNKVQEMSFRAVAALSEAFSVLEVGSLGVVRFGERPEVVVPPKERVGPADGAALLANFTFAQPLTKFAELLRASGSIFDRSGASSSSGVPSDKLLVILSDGRGENVCLPCCMFSYI